LLDRRVTVEQKSVAREATFGGETISWVPLVSNVPAQVLESPTAGEFKAGVVSAYARPTIVRMRYSSGLATTDPSMRINYGGRLLKIIGVAHKGRSAGLMEFACQEWAHE